MFLILSYLVKYLVTCQITLVLKYSVLLMLPWVGFGTKAGQKVSVALQQYEMKMRLCTCRYTIFSFASAQVGV